MRLCRRFASKTTRAVDTLLDLRLVNHSVVCLSELTHLFGRLDPRPRTKFALKQIAGVIADIPNHRLGAPSAQVCGKLECLLVSSSDHAIRETKPPQRPAE